MGYLLLSSGTLLEGSFSRAHRGRYQSCVFRAPLDDVWKRLYRNKNLVSISILMYHR